MESTISNLEINFTTKQLVKLPHNKLHTQFIAFNNRSVTSYHNPIFTSEIFSGVGMQNEIARTEPVWPDRGPPHQKNLKEGPGAHFPEFGEVWPSLTKVNQVWPRFDRTKSRIGLTAPNHWIEHIESFDSVLYGSKTDEKRESYGQNRENRSNT